MKTISMIRFLYLFLSFLLLADGPAFAGKDKGEKGGFKFFKRKTCNPLKVRSKRIRKSIFKLQMIHLADQEGNINALEDAPRASSIIETFKPTVKNTVVVSSGDNFLSSVFSKTSENEEMRNLLGVPGFGRADILINNALGVQVSAIGNHEFDKGPEAFYQLVKSDGAYPGTSFPYLSANIDFSSDDQLKQLVTTNDQEASSLANKIANTTVITVNGRKIGFIGAVTQELDRIAKTGSLEITPEADKRDENYKNLAAIIQKHADRLTENGVDIIVVLAHMQQLSIEEKLAGLLRNVDIIAGGGSDSILIDKNDRLRDGHQAYGKYPLWKKDADGKNIVVVNTDGQYRYVGRLVAYFNKKGNLVKRLHNQCESGAFATDAEGVAFLGNTPANPVVTNIIKKIDSIIGPKARRNIAKTEVFLDGERENLRRSFTNLGTLTAESLIWYTKEFYGIETLATIRNSGGIRASIGRIEVAPGSTISQKLPPVGGNVTELDIETALAFDNGVSVLQLTGKDIIDQIEFMIDSKLETDGSGTPMTPLKLVKNGKFPQLAGFEIEYDISKKPLERLVNLKISNGDDLVVDGKFINLNKEYLVATLSYLADGKESVFGRIPKDKRTDLQPLSPIKQGVFEFAPSGGEQDAFAEYMNFKYSQDPFKAN